MKTFLATTALTAMMVTGASAQGIAVGQEGRGYEARGLAIVGQLRGEWETVNFTGSEDIARSVCGDNTVPTTTGEPSNVDTPIGIAQIDAIMVMQWENCQLQTLAEYPSQEYAFILFPPGTSLNELDDLGPDNRVLVDQVGSGTSLFWQTIVRIEEEHGNGSEWASAQPVNGATIFADGEAKLGNIDALVLVGDPGSDEVQTLLSQDWELGELYDKDINDMQFGRGNLYDRETITIDHPNKFWNEKNDAYVVRSFFIANRDWSSTNQSEAARMVRIMQGLQ